MSFPIKQYGLMREGRRPNAYSVSFPDVMSMNGVREDRAVGMMAQVAKGGNMAVKNDFDTVPIFQRPLVNATWNAEAHRWTRIVKQGEGGFTLTPQEPYREVLYRCRPFWYRMELTGQSGPERVSVSPEPLPGYTLAPMFRNGQDPVYRPAFEMGIGADGLPHSRAGLIPLHSDGISLMTQARRYDPRARLEGVMDWFSDLLLLLVEFATWDLDALMNGNRGNVAETGAGMVDLIASSGGVGNGVACVWRGKENPWKNARSLLCDICLRSTPTDSGYETCLYYLPDVRYFDGTVNENYLKVGTYPDDGTNGVMPIRGFAFQKGIFYPAHSTMQEEELRSISVLLSDPSDDRMITVGVGGGSDGNLLPPLLPGMPSLWEAVQLGHEQSGAFGGRLILDEGG